MFVRTAPVLAVALVLCACGSGDTKPVAAAPTPEPTPTAAGGPVPLGCEHAVPATQVATPKGLVRPDDLRVIVASTSKRPDDPRITVVEGYVEKVPSALMKSFTGAKDLRVIFSEDEEFEAEVLVSDGRYRAFWKVVRTCLAASRFTALYSSERSASVVAGAAPPTKTPIPRR